MSAGRRGLGILMVAAAFLGMGCGNRPATPEVPLDRYNSGTIHISCDESFKPVIDAQVAVYESQFPDTKIIVHYKPEAECLRDFLVDSIRMVIATRGFSANEDLKIVDSLKLEPQKLTVARDAVAVVVNRNATDTIFNMAELRALLSGSGKESLIPVFDGTKATSTVRFMLDSVLRGGQLSPKVSAAQSSTGVIDYVSRVPNAVGFVGFSWIGAGDDTAQVARRKKVRLAWIESTDSTGGYVMPSQYTIYTGSYPMVRDLVYVLKERHQGLGHAFARFLAQSDKGQLIFRRSYLMPVINTQYIRDARLNDSIPGQ